MYRLLSLSVVLARLSLGAAPSPLTVQISNETAPPGGWAQIKFLLPEPHQVANGVLYVFFDPLVVASIGNVEVFGAAGDTAGAATVSGLTLEVNFGSWSGNGIGEVRGLPILVVNVAVLASASPGARGSITAQIPISPEPSWSDSRGNPYTVSFISGSLTVGGSISIQNIEPGGGILPAGTLVRVMGSGFTSATTLAVDEVAVSAVQFVGPQEIDLTLAAQAELTGKRFVLTDPDETTLEYVSFLPAVPFRLPSSGMYSAQHSIQPLFPLLQWSTPLSAFLPPDSALAFQNPSLNPVSIDLQLLWQPPQSMGELTTTIPPGSMAIYSGDADGLPEGLGETDFTETGPIRALTLSLCPCYGYDTAVGIVGLPEVASQSQENPPTPTSSMPPLIGAVVNAASRMQGAVTPGEIVTLYGFGVGPPYISGFLLNSDGSVATYAGGTRVLFDGKAAPLLYSSPFQTNAIVPYEIANQHSTNIEVIYNGATSAAWGVPVAAAAPAIFTLVAGIGQGAVLNQNNSVNGAANPARRGQVIQIFATGEGQTSPPGLTGTVTGSNLKTPVLPVKVTIGGVAASVAFAGSAPDAVTGLLQVNATVPQGITPGPAVPILLTIGNFVSPDGVTIAVQ